MNEKEAMKKILERVVENLKYVAERDINLADYELLEDVENVLLRERKEGGSEQANTGL